MDQKKMNGNVENSCKANANNTMNDFEMLFNEVSDVLFLTDLEGNFILANKMACEQFGYSSDQIVTLNVRDLISSEMNEKYDHLLQELIEKREISFEVSHLNIHNEEVYVKVISKIINYKGQEVIFNNSRDITFRKAYENELVIARENARKHEAELQAVFKEVPSIIILFDEQKRLIKINQDLIPCNDHSYEFVRDIIKCLHNGETNENNLQNDHSQPCDFCQLLNDTIQHKEEFYKKEIPIKSANAGVITQHTLMISTTILYENSEIVYMACIDDITKQKQLETELKKAKLKAQESERLKSAFLANISHEVRTPLNGIIGFSSLLGESNLTKEQRQKYIDTINHSSNRLLSTIDDILEVSRLDGQLTEITMEIMNLENFIGSLIENNHWVYSKSAINFSVHIDENIRPLSIQTDLNKLSQIIKNVLSNAFKFTSDGYVIMSIMNNNKDILISIEDSGIGIPASDTEKIFEPFIQLDNSLNRNHEGNGLGLTIAKKLTLLLKGEIWTAPQKQGSKFFISIPDILSTSSNIYDSKIINSVSLQMQELTKKTILIAEDEISNYEYLEAVLATEGYNLIHADNGQKALNICKQRDDIDLIIMDIKMPVMDGYVATQKIKEISNNIPVVAHSAFNLSSDKQKALDVGCVDFITKPVNPDQLISTISKNLKESITKKAG